MKPQPEYDFPVSAWPLDADKPIQTARLYAGIWRLLLNYTVQIFFVPPFMDRVTAWPPRLPENVDEAGNEIEARLTTVALASYSVTVNDALSATEELLTSHDPEFDDANVIFYVDRKEFAEYHSELARLFDRIHSPWQGIRISELADQHLARFVLSRFLVSPHVDRRSLHILGR